MEFSLKFPDCGIDFLKTFLVNVVDPSFSYAEKSKNVVLKNLAAASKNYDDGNTTHLTRIVMAK